MTASTGGAEILPGPDGMMIRRSTGERAALYIRRLIFEGHLGQGDRVPQDDIARALGVSRIPVREALLSMEREGWVTIVPHRGAFIDQLDEMVLRDLYSLYGMLYGLAARRAALHRTTEVADRLAELCSELASCDEPARGGPDQRRVQPPGPDCGQLGCGRCCAG